MGGSKLEPSMTAKYPTNRDVNIKTGETWLQGKRQDDGAEQLWRIHDNLYDFKYFQEIHPGGMSWLKMTRGTDITEAFESHHISSGPAKLLQYYFVRPASSPRNSKITFKDDGFYKTLKRRAAPKLKAVNKYVKWKTKIIADLLLLSTLASCYWCATVNSLWATLGPAILLALATIAAHNFIHRRDNFRMWYFNVSLLSFRDWRVSHVLSHHLYPNTLLDYELSIFEPFMKWAVYPCKNFMQRYLAVVYEWFFYAILYVIALGARVLRCFMYKKNCFHWDEVIFPLLIPATLYYSNPELGWRGTFDLWMAIIFISSTIFGFISLGHGSHHNSSVFHEGDPIKEYDFGAFQLQTVSENPVIKNNLFLALTNFGDHALHHLFPAVDQAELPYLNDVVADTCNEFGIQLSFTNSFDTIVEQVYQLGRMTPRSVSTKKVK